MPGDEVIVQSAVHPFACLPIVGCGAVPVFAGLDRELTTLDPADVERRVTPRTRAVIVVHWNGMPADMDGILDVAGRHNLRVLEDNNRRFFGGSERSHLMVHGGMAGNVMPELLTCCASLGCGNPDPAVFK